MNIWSALAVILAAAGLFWADMAWFGQAGIAFLGKSLIDIINWLAFWR